MEELYFESLELIDRAELLWKKGYYLESIDNFDYRINLYAYGNRFVEVRYNKITNDIDKIALANDKELKKYLSKVIFSNYY